MRTTIFGLILIALSAHVSANEHAASLTRDVWIPFVEGVNANDPARYNGVNSKDFFWVAAGPRTRIMNLHEYITDAVVVFKAREKKGAKGEIDVRFMERHVNSEFASEKIIMKYTATEPGVAPQTSYGIMQIFSRKENGVWRKLVQQVNLGSATPEMWSAATPLS